MKNFKQEYKELRNEALNNWFTKELVNDKMQPNMLIGIVISETRDNESELGLGMKFFDLLMRWSGTFVSEGYNHTVNKLNTDLI